MMIDFNGVSTCQGLFYVKVLEVTFIVHIYIFCVVIQELFLNTVLSNTNNF